MFIGSIKRLIRRFFKDIMSYSKIKGIEIKNFRNIKYAAVDMRKSPILILMGENDAGKTSFIKAVTVASTNAFSDKHQKYIKDDTNGFGIGIDLESNTRVVRVKTANSNGFQIHQDGELKWSTSKIDRGYGIPVEVEKVMGMIQEPETKELLQVRTYENQLLFALTKESENYKVMYNALKIDNISKALKIGNKEINDLKNNINKCEANIETYKQNLGRIKIKDISSILGMRDKMKADLEKLKKLDKAMSLLEANAKINRQIAYLEELNSTEEINSIEAYKLNHYSKLMTEREKLKNVDLLYNLISQTSEIDYSSYEKINNVLHIMNENKLLQEKYKVYRDLGNTEEINTEYILKMERLLELRNTNIKIANKITGSGINTTQGVSDRTLNNMINMEKVLGLMNINKDLTVNINELSKEVQEYDSILKQSGAIILQCPKCGEDVVSENHQAC